MNAFGDNFEQQSEVDPAAEFLAREQNALAGLEDEIPPVAAGAGASANGSVNGDPVPKAESTGLENELNGSFEMISNADAQDPPTTTTGDNNLNTEDDNDDFAGFTVPKQVTEEPEKIRKWREDQKARLEEKDREEERKKDELREQARKELEDWYKHHEETISKTKSANRESAKNAEKQFVAETDEIEPGTEWERIAKLCDFNPKTNKSNKDISRMRSIILQLKQNPLQATKKV
ncbi:clathrin light chain isoform X1 [Anopheles arabiensis]|uniref:clathrin light chain isoform X1 n=1 Tax=Anopheles arabiensis TaxID=7173 RepID=UPI001AACC971|nr:clathrin light chain isoform X1 [Anopheles arabiensis]XP_041780809.1 clathrin light chain isoform X1 [Anopheles merus]